MKDRLSTLLLITLSAGLLALGSISCATPAVKKPDIDKPSNTQGSQNTNTTSTSGKKKTTAKLQQRPLAHELNDSVVFVDSVSVERKAP